MRDPFPGWNQGVNTSAPLTYLSGRGYRFYPAKGELVLDIIPVDLAAHAMIPILAALLAGRHKPIYQLCTSDVNPLPMRRLVELTGLSNRREHRRVGGPMGRFAPHLEAVVVSQSTYELASQTLPELLKKGAGAARTLLGEDSERAKKFAQGVEKFGANTAMARELVEVYRPYIQELVYTFHGTNIRALYKSLAAADAEHHPYAPERIDWADYWINVHLPGLRRHIFRSLDLHTRGRPTGSGASSNADRDAGPRGRALRLAAGAGRAPAFGRAHSRRPIASCATARIAPDCCSGCAGSSPATACCSSARTRPSG